MITTIPNIITMFRIATVPVLIILLHEHEYGWAFLVFLVSGISDGLDGFIAKRFDMASELGAILDPLADKALIFSSYLMLMLLGDLPFWLFLTVIFRDVLILAGSLIYVAFYGQVKMAPSYLSKLNTNLRSGLSHLHELSNLCHFYNNDTQWCALCLGLDCERGDRDGGKCE
jgi:cardiolipin synthase